MSLFSKIVGSVPGLGDAVELASIAKTGFDLFAGDDDVPSEVREAGQNVSAISRALMDPDDPLFQRIAGEEEGLIAKDFTEALRQVGLENQRMMGRTGGMGILDPERRDEALAGAFAKSFAERKQMARDQARSYLSSALDANRGVAGAFAPMIAGDQRERERQASGMQMLLDLVQQPNQSQGVNFDVSVMNPPNLSFGTGSSRPAVSTYTTPGLSFND